MREGGARCRLVERRLFRMQRNSNDAGGEGTWPDQADVDDQVASIASLASLMAKKGDGGV